MQMGERHHLALNDAIHQLRADLAEATRLVEAAEADNAALIAAVALRNEVVIECDCASVAPTMPTARQEHLVLCQAHPEMAPLIWKKYFAEHKATLQQELRFMAAHIAEREAYKAKIRELEIERANLLEVAGASLSDDDEVKTKIERLRAVARTAKEQMSNDFDHYAPDDCGTCTALDALQPGDLND